MKCLQYYKEKINSKRSNIMMQLKKDIVFLQSDASYNHKNKFANLTVFDTYENRFYNSSMFEIKNSTVAEYNALVLSDQCFHSFHK